LGDEGDDGLPSSEVGIGVCNSLSVFLFKEFGCRLVGNYPTQDCFNFGCHLSTRAANDARNGFLYSSIWVDYEFQGFHGHGLYQLRWEGFEESGCGIEAGYLTR
jgi:hypothetical protein